MAKDNSFDVVSQVDMQEVDNAYGQASKELSQRYDLKDSGSEISLDKAKGELTVVAHRRRDNIGHKHHSPTVFTPPA